MLGHLRPRPAKGGKGGKRGRRNFLRTPPPRFLRSRGVSRPRHGRDAVKTRVVFLEFAPYCFVGHSCNEPFVPACHLFRAMVLHRITQDGEAWAGLTSVASFASCCSLVQSGHSCCEPIVLGSHLDLRSMEKRAHCSHFESGQYCCVLFRPSSFLFSTWKSLVAAQV